jgi:replicative DNA helicase
MKDLFKTEPKKSFTPKYKTEAKPTEDQPKMKPVIETTYSYTDALGRELFQAVRLKPKSFRQRHKDGKGNWVWSMDGVERVLYRLPEVILAQQVWIVEGEKDADNLNALGYCATCNVGGAGKWLDGYTASLAGKDVVICGDNDEPGKKHVELVFDSIASKVKSVKILKLPEKCKDVSDFIAIHPEQAKKLLEENIAGTVPHFGGIKLPLYTMAEIEPQYELLVRNSSTMQLDFSSWLPTLGRNTRPLIPGEVGLFIADTKVGKTALMQTIALKAVHLDTIIFQMELPPELMFERFLAMRTKKKCVEIESIYKGCEERFGAETLNKSFPNFLICPEPRLTPERMEKIINAAELKIGRKPRLVLVDYVQLMQGTGSSRYEKASMIGESIKEIAKATKTILVACSQVGRPERSNSDRPYEPSLHSAKDSGSFENSAGLVIGMHRDPQDQFAMHLKVLAATKGGAGTKIVCNFDGERMLITERANEPVQ